jgi:anti-sigma factor RsiW
MKDINQQQCERADELVSFLYGELNEKESSQFARHLHDCRSCSLEFESFGQIRNSIVAWRDESLGVASLTSMPAIARDNRRSAIAAIREFFSLAPLWMKGATVCASLLFCLTAVLAFAYLTHKQPTTVAISPEKIYSKQDLEAQVAIEKQKFVESQLSSKVATAEDTAQKEVVKRSVVKTPTRYQAIARNLRKPLTRQERAELASDLGLIASRDDDDLDFGNDKINPSPR